MALLRAKAVLAGLKFEGEQRFGVDIVARALEEPVHQGALRPAGRVDRHARGAIGGEGPGDIDPLATGVDLARGRPKDLSDDELVDGHRAVDAGVEGQGDDHAQITSGPAASISLTVSASGRYDHYNDFGGTFNPKFGAGQDAFDALQRRIRPPTM